MALITLFDFIGTLGFLGACVIAVRNYTLTKHANAYWLVFAVASFIGMVWAGSVTLEWLNVAPAVLDDVQQSIAAASITGFAIAALLTTTSFIRPE